MSKEYRDTISGWDKELYTVYKKHYFRTIGLESQQLRRLIRQFSDLQPQEELGWASQVTELEA